MHHLRRKKQEAEDKPQNETRTRRATRILTGAAMTVASKMFSTKPDSVTSFIDVSHSIEPTAVVPDTPVDSPKKGEQRNRKSLFQRGKDFVGLGAPGKSREAPPATKAAEHEELNVTNIESFCLTDSQSGDLYGSALTAGTVTPAANTTTNAVHLPKAGELSVVRWIQTSEETLQRRIRQEEAQLLHESSNISSLSTTSYDYSPKTSNPFVKNSEVDKHKTVHHPKASEVCHKGKKKVADRSDEWTCWHVTAVDVIINFQLYELLQKKWRFKVAELLEDKKESEAEIISDMINKRRLVKEEINGDAKHTIGFKTKLIQKFMEKVFSNVERCVLVEQDYQGFLGITFGQVVDFNTQEHLDFIKHHRDLGKDYRNLMKPSTDDSDDDLLHEHRKPKMSDHEALQLREVFVQLDKYDTGGVSVQELKRHNDFCVADFSSFEFMEFVDFDVFLALVCPSTHRTTSTVWEIIIKKMRSRLEELSDAGRSDMPLAEALASLEDPLLPTLPPQIHQIYHEVYDQLDWFSSSCLVAWIKNGIKSLIEEPRAIGYSLRLENSGRLSFAEFSGFVRLDGYKRFGKASLPPAGSKRQALTGREVSDPSLLPTRPARRH